MQGFMHFIAKHYLWPKTRTRGLNQPPWAEDVTHTGVKNLAWGFNSTTPPSTHTLCIYVVKFVFARIYFMLYHQHVKIQLKLHSHCRSDQLDQAIGNWFGSLGISSRGGRHGSGFLHGNFWLSKSRVSIEIREAKRSRSDQELIGYVWSSRGRVDREMIVWGSSVVGIKVSFADQYPNNSTSTRPISDRYSTIHEWTGSGTSRVKLDRSSLVREFGWSGRSSWSDQQCEHSLTPVTHPYIVRVLYCHLWPAASYRGRSVTLCCFSDCSTDLVFCQFKIAVPLSVASSS